MSYYVGRFTDLNHNFGYTVYITPMNDTDYQEIEVPLALNAPLTITYDECESIYSPLRTSTAQINIVYSDYLFDCFKNLPLGTRVEITRGYPHDHVGPIPQRPTTIWTGFLQNNLLNAGYEKCTETISLQASDYLLQSQYIPYKTVGETKNIVNFKDIFETMFAQMDVEENNFGLDVYWPASRMIDGKIVKLEDLQISEFNFFSSDTDKAWSYRDVIEEIAKYFGFTAMLWHEAIYFMDYEAFTRRDNMKFFKYKWRYGTLELVNNYYVIEGGTLDISADDYTRNGGQVSFKTPYNKIKVNDNFFDADIVVPDIFDDNTLTYLYGGKNEVRPITQPMGRPKYIGADTKINFESKEKNYYYRKELNNPNYEEKWYTAAESAVTKQELDDFTEFAVNRWAEFDTPLVTTLYGWRWQCYWGASPYSLTTWESTISGGYTDDFQLSGTHTEIGSYQQWQNGDNSKTFEVEFLGRYAWQNQWLANFDLKYYSPTAPYQGSFTFIADNQWHEYVENEGENPVFYYCVNPWQGAVGFIPFSNDWRISTTYPIYSNEAPDYMPQISQDLYLPITYTGITGAGADYTVFNYRSDKARTYTATLWYADYSASTTFTVEAHSALTVTTNILGIQINREEDRDRWALQVVSEEGTSGATSWSRLNITSPVYPQNVELIKKWIGSRVIELADVPKEEKNPTNKLNFTRYLLLAQHGTPIDKNNAISNHLPLYELKSLNAPAVFVADGTYFYIQCNALFTRYWGIDYIGDWAQDKSRIYHNDGGPTQNNTPALVFCFGIGDKYWDGYKWVNSKCNFKVQLYNSGDDGSQEEQKDLKCWNLSMPIKNQIGWAQWTSGEGYKIKFDESLDLNGKITFEICSPVQLQAAPNTSMPGGGSWGSFDSSFNGYCWISDLKVGIAIRNDMKYSNADIIYENVIEENSLNEFNEINLKITTYPKLGKLGYSHLGFNGKMIDTVVDTNLDEEGVIPEAAIIERYYGQYSTPTKLEYITLGLDSTPFILHHDSYWDADFAVIGQTMDLYLGQNSLALEEVKKNNETVETGGIKYWLTPGGTEPDWYSRDWSRFNDVPQTVKEHGYDSATGEGYIYFNDELGLIPNGMFSNESRLIKIELPYSLQQINQNAISGNTNLTAITSNAFVAPYLQSSALSGNSHQNGSILTVPEGADYAIWNNNWYERLGAYWINRTLAFAQTGATVSFKGGSYNVAYTYDGIEKIRVSNISINGVTVQVQDGNMVYTVPANPSVTSGRTFTITITNGIGASATFTVTQPMATYSLQQNVLEARLNAKGNIGEPLEVLYDGNTNNLTISASTDWLNVSFGNWANGDNGFKSCLLEYSALENTTASARTGSITVTDGVNSVSFHIEQEKAIHVSEIEVWYNIGAGWLKAPSYNSAETDFLLPIEAKGGGELIIRFTSDDNRSSNIYFAGQTEGYQTGQYRGMFVSGAKMYYWDNNPLLGGKYFRFNESWLGSFSQALVTTDSLLSLKERFNLYKLYHNSDGQWDATQGTFFGIYDTYILSFDLYSQNENQLLSKHQFRIHLRKN